MCQRSTARNENNNDKLKLVMQMTVIYFLFFGARPRLLHSHSWYAILPFPFVTFHFSLWQLFPPKSRVTNGANGPFQLFQLCGVCDVRAI